MDTMMGLLRTVLVCQIVQFTPSAVLAKSLPRFDVTSSTLIQDTLFTLPPSRHAPSTVQTALSTKPRLFTKTLLFSKVETSTPGAAHVSGSRQTDATPADKKTTAVISSSLVQNIHHSSRDYPQQQQRESPSSYPFSTLSPPPSHSSEVSSSSSSSSLLITKISPGPRPKQTTLAPSRSYSKLRHSKQPPLTKDGGLTHTGSLSEHVTIPSYPGTKQSSREKLVAGIVYLLETLAAKGKSFTSSEGETSTTRKTGMGSNDDGIDDDDGGNDDSDEDDSDDNDDYRIERRRYPNQDVTHNKVPNFRRANPGHENGHVKVVDAGIPDDDDGDDSDDEDSHNNHGNLNGYGERNVKPARNVQSSRTTTRPTKVPCTTSASSQSWRAQLSKMTVTQLVQIFARVRAAIKTGVNSNGQVVIGTITISITKITTVKISELCCFP